uniref:G-protein coupled receptors family 3 profile domain-containing protein n=1 Tax=Denticeps clupeoides TaxID=299321 RepID=A0AAY4ARK6_9TELE
MAALLTFLILGSGAALGSNYGYVEWSENDRDAEARTPETQRRPAATERAALAPRLEEELPRVAAAFLHTGDAAALRRVTCARRYELGGLRATPHPALRRALDAALHARAFLSALPRADDGTREQGARWYRALARATLEGDPRIHRAVVALGPGPRVLLQATRSHRDVLLQDLSSSGPNRTHQSEWYAELRDRRGPDRSQVRWSAPYLECENGRFVPHWLLTLSAPFYSPRTNLTPEFRGVVRVDVNLQDVDIDQCSSNGWFGGTHRCNLTSMECKPVEGHGFVLDKYKCQCKRGFYHPHRVVLKFWPPGTERGEEAVEVPGKCLPCQEGCVFCRDDRPCLVQEDSTLRLSMVSFQGLCMGLDFISMLVVYHFRRNKRIRASGLVLLEAVLVGTLLLYFPVMIIYFHPSVLHCVLLRWARLLGFTTVYGTITLKLYRVLKVFLSRTAQRIPYMTSCRVLRLLGIIHLVVCWFLVAWTSAVCQNPDRERTLIDVGTTPEGLQYSMCRLDRWDYMMAVAEFLFLLWSVYLCYAVRTVPSAFHEPRYMAAAVYNELLISAIFHVIRFSLAPGLHPDWMLTLFFVHTHLTVTVTLGLLLVPKFLFSGTHTRDDIATEAYEDELDMRRSGSYLNSSINSAWSEHSLDPEDIREELKKLYAQLEIYKRKKMLANNPHLQKKRSSKKGLGRSLMRRITEIPETMSRQCSREDRDGSEHGSNRSTLRRNPFEPSHSGKSREDSLKNKVFSLKKSHSYDHVCDQNGDPAGPPTHKMDTSTAEGSLLDTLMGRKPKKAPEAEKVNSAQSAESLLLVCKSVSAHNLTADKKPIHLRTSIMQKSLSVITSAKEKTLGLAGKTHSVEDASRNGGKVRDCRMLSEVDESPESTYPKMIISQSVEYTKTPSKMGIMKQQVSGSQPSICSESGRSKDLYDLSEVCPWEVEDLPTPSEGKTQKHVSIAPGEPTTVHGGSFKSGRKPKSPLSLGVKKVEVCPWDFEDPSSSGMETVGLSPDRSGRKKSVTPTGGKPKILHSDHSKSTGSLLQPPALMVEICPWDLDAPPSPKQDKSCSPTCHPKPNESHSKRKGSCSSKSKDKEDEKQRSKSRERRHSSSKTSEKRRVSQSSDTGQVTMTTSTRRRSSTREASDHSRPGVCPWEVEGVSGGATKDSISSARETSPNTKTGTTHPSMADVCPWDFEDKSSGKSA